MKDCQVHIEGLCIETAFIYDFTSHGELFPIDYVSIEAKEGNKDANNSIPIDRNRKDKLHLLTTDQLSNLTRTTLSNSLVICIDENQAVSESLFVIEGEVYSNEIGSSASLEKIKTASVAMIVYLEGDLTTLKNSLVSQDKNIALGENSSFAKQVFESFLKGDVVRYKLGVNYINTLDLASLIAKRMDSTSVFLTMDSKEYATVEEDTFLLEGKLEHFHKEKKYELRIVYGDGREESFKEMKASVTSDRFSVSVPLTLGANYIDCTLLEDGVELSDSKHTHIVFYKQARNQPKEIIMWAEQYVNAETTKTVERIEALIQTAKDAGITAFALDVKGCEGYAAYRKATLTNVKYMTETTNPKKAFHMEIDFLEEFVKAAHASGLRVYASFNFFVEGNIASNDFAIDLPNTHPDWAEVLHVPEDQGELKSVLETKRNCMLCYVNPANKEVQDFELLRVKELLDHYEVDGVIMDRTRYDNQYADFSEVTRIQFVEYLKNKGKELVHWPGDIYSFDAEQKMIFGPLYLDWLTFRSSIIQGFAKRLRGIVDEYAENQERPIALAAYVGSWFDLYYQNGVNWGSKDFRYNERLNFPVSKLYTEEYSKTSYVDYIDFLMIGCYYDTSEMIEKYTTIGNIVTNNQVPMMASMSLPDLNTEELLKIGTKACIDFSDGTMIFDLCYTDWNMLRPALKAALTK
ncbi:family 10 glycosylhydrolase [Lachnoclostridium sp.]|uniref:family 10 glycosylhydrolase n=1 Tax=Lachnoclostridium sp. TaxID=2028282 RepID=UPI00289F90B5|nr:family 10 glycosylhydrolase [Lachnoclostridium sp.]